MIASGIKDYFKSLKFYFTPLGIRTLAGLCTPFRFSRPAPSTTWVILHMVDQEDHDTPTIRLWAEGSSFELLVLLLIKGFFNPNYYLSGS